MVRKRQAYRGGRSGGKKSVLVGRLLSIWRRIAQLKARVERFGSTSRLASDPFLRTDEKAEVWILIYPAMTVFFSVASASIVLFVTLWSFPASIDVVAKMFCIGWIQVYFPGEWWHASYLAQRYGGPWDVYFASLLMVNLTSGIFATIFFTLLVVYYPLKISSRENLDDQKLLKPISDSYKRMRLASFGIACLTIVIAGLLYPLLFLVNPAIDLSALRRPLPVKFIAEHILMMFLPSLIVLFGFVIKILIFLSRLKRRLSKDLLRNGQKARRPLDGLSAARRVG